MTKRISSICALVLVITLSLGCIAGCPTQLLSDDRDSIEELSDEVENLQSQLESIKAQPTPTAASTPTPIPTPTPTPVVETVSDNELTIWSFTNELKTLTIAFMEANPDVTINYVEISLTNNEFQNQLAVLPSQMIVRTSSHLNLRS